MTKDLLKKIEECLPEEKKKDTPRSLIKFDHSVEYFNGYSSDSDPAWNDCRQATIASLPEVLRIVAKEIGKLPYTSHAISKDEMGKFVRLEDIINLLTK